jgi:hypothetical protein
VAVRRVVARVPHGVVADVPLVVELGLVVVAPVFAGVVYRPVGGRVGSVALHRLRRVLPLAAVAVPALVRVGVCGLHPRGVFPRTVPVCMAAPVRVVLALPRG